MLRVVSTGIPRAARAFVLPAVKLSVSPSRYPAFYPAVRPAVRSSFQPRRAFHPALPRRTPQNPASHSDPHARSRSRSRTRTRILIAAPLLLAAAYALDENHTRKTLRHVYFTVKRVAVVTSAMIQCFYHYRRCLDAPYASEEEKSAALSRCHLKCAQITLKALEANAGIYIKFGQHISAMTYLFPPEWTETMTPLQDKCPQSSLEAIRALFRTDLKAELEDIFSEFEPEPLGTASLAQVHRARLRSSGQAVAVKIQHPALREFIPVDVYMTQLVFNLMYKAFPEYPLTWLGDELQSSIYVELDFRAEAANARRTAQDFAPYKSQTALRVPEIISASERVLVMEYVAGARPDDLEFMAAHGIDRAELSTCFAHIFDRMIFTPGLGVHCDPHGGNLAIRAVPPSEQKARKLRHNFEVILYDHGLYRDVPDDLRYNYAQFWLALLDRNVPLMRKYAREFANVSDEQFPLFAAAITGRDFEHALGGKVTTERTKAEIDHMMSAIASGKVIAPLMSLLAQMPRVVLLILKTNDLTRHLDESLQSPKGPERTFLVLASYCARNVYERDVAQLEARRKQLIAQGGSAKWIKQWGILVKELSVWVKYLRRVNELLVFDFIVGVKSLLQWL